ncbi:DNA polymerase III subunit delta [Myxococcota bacterium]|nr:DNA polymerase III subunit delta [Myxococcota bacterium]
MTPEELRAELESGCVRPVYLVAGDEPLHRDDSIASLRELLLANGPSDFNFEVLGPGHSGGALTDALRTLPVMAPFRLVLLKLGSGARGAPSELTDAVAEICLSELDAGTAEEGSSVLAVVVPKIDRRSKWVKAIGRDALVNCDAPSKLAEVAAFVTSEARAQGVELERGVAKLLAERIGPQLLLLRNEIAKAALFAGPGSPVTRSHVAAGTPDIAEGPVWDLTDAIGDGRADQALEALSKLLSAGAPPPVLLGALASHFRGLVRVRYGGAISRPAFVVRKMEGQARRYTARRLLNCMDAIRETDMALKGAGVLRPEAALERLVIGLSG